MEKSTHLAKYSGLATKAVEAVKLLDDKDKKKRASVPGKLFSLFEAVQQMEDGDLHEFFTVLRDECNLPERKIAELYLAYASRGDVKTALITLPGARTFEAPMIVGTEGEEALSIVGLRDATGCITLDPGFRNTASCKSAITFLDGEKGILRYRGYPIEQLAENADFIETAMLLIWGELPLLEERAEFRELLTDNEMIHEDLRKIFESFPPNGEPMALLSAFMSSVSFYEPELLKVSSDSDFMLLVAKLMSQIRTIAANTYNKSKGRPLNYPDPSMRYCENFLSMMHSIPNKKHTPTEEEVRALELVLMLHADHEQNCSTSAVRLVGSSGANTFVSVSAGVDALYGPLHGGANVEVMEMLENAYNTGMPQEDLIEMAKSKDPNVKKKLVGFGHVVYRNFDPRAQILKKTAEKLLDRPGKSDPLLDYARRLEQLALADPYFKDHNLYPNVDFYSGLILKSLGIPREMFTVMFAMGRLPGWLAQWREASLDPDNKIGRPRQVYIGETLRDYIARKLREVGCFGKKDE